MISQRNWRKGIMWIKKKVGAHGVNGEESGEPKRGEAWGLIEEREIEDQGHAKIEGQLSEHFS